MDGTVREVNENFARVMGYSRAEVVGKHHSMFVESRPTPAAPSTAASGTSSTAASTTSAATSASPRAAAKCGSRLLQPDPRRRTASRSRSSSTPPTSPSRWCATPTSQASSPPSAGAGRHRVRPGRHDAQGQRELRAASWATRVSEVRRQAPQHVRRRRRIGGSAEYRAFWAKLDARRSRRRARYRRIAKGGREVWMQASYNPIPDANGKPFKVVEVRHRCHRSRCRRSSSCSSRSADAGAR